MKKRIIMLVAIAFAVVLSLSSCDVVGNLDGILGGFSASEHTVSFEVNGGNEISSITVKHGDTVTLPTPVREGYTFQGWYKDEALTLSVQSVMTVNEDTVLYAKWTKNEVPTPDPVKHNVTFVHNNGTTNETVSVTDGETVTKPADPTKEGYIFDGWYKDAVLSEEFDFSTAIKSDTVVYAGWKKNTPIIDVTEGEIKFKTTGVSFETVYCEWTPVSGADGYVVYCDGEKVDFELIRSYGTYYRCDILGLTAKEHEIAVVPVADGKEHTELQSKFKATPIAHVREGFAFQGGSASGAYNDDGTLKSDAVVIYINNLNKDTVSLNMKVDKNKSEVKVGIQNIILGLKKGYYEHPLCIRFLGNITDPAVLEKGDLKIDINDGAFSKGLTIEGVGNDATINGFGICVKGATNVEIRNLGVMNCDSSEGDNISLQQDNSYIWVHNCDLFYGEAGKDSDQSKGDGALDTKTSTHITISFNHFYDTGKSNLQGMKSESTENCITYHHNWYDHSDSRHPRVRTCTVHVYNNYYDGVSKYGVGATMGASVFVENNYFRNTKYAMLISMQGSDIAGDGTGTFSKEDGGIIKAYGNVIIGGNTLVSYSQSSTQFDFYDAKTRDELVPEAVKTLKGATTYNNFDTSKDMYEYNVQSAEDARDTVIAYAGRVQGGDFKWTFNNAVDDTDYGVNAKLKAALKNYKCNLVLEDLPNNNEGTGEGGELGGNEGNGGSGETGGNEGTGGSTGGTVIEGSVTHNFTTQGATSEFFTISGNLSTGKGSVTYGGLTLTQCLKMESSTSIKFTLENEAKVTLIFGSNGNANCKIDGIKCQDATSDGDARIITVTLTAGEHTITKADVANLFYISVE